jgi:hypothetical protein
MDTPTDSPTPTDTPTETPSPTPTPTPTPAPASVPQATVTVDGSVDSGVSGSTPAFRLEQGKRFTPDDSVGEPPNGDVWFRWDSDNFYFVARIEDDTHVNTKESGSLWHDDSIQFGLSPNTREFIQFTMARNEEGPQVDISRAPYQQEMDFEPSLDIGRDDDAEETVYELAVPWSALAELDEEFQAESGAEVFVGYIFIDEDAQDANLSAGNYYVEGTGGALDGSKEPQKLRTAILE